MAGRKSKDPNNQREPSKLAGEMLAEYRTKAGHTRATLAKVTGLNVYTIKLYEDGGIVNPSVDVFNALHDGLLTSGFIGWALLEAYGFKTDAGADGVPPALAQIISLLDQDAQDILLRQAAREFRRSN